MTETCKNEVTKYNLKGTYLIIPNQNCETQIQDKIISTASTTKTTETSLQLKPVSLPELQQDIQMDNNRVDLRDVDLNDIREILNSAKYSSESDSDIVITKDISIWTISAFVIIIVLITIYVIAKFKIFNKVYISKRNHPDTDKSSPADFSLREGGVKGGHPIDISFISNK